MPEDSVFRSYLRDASVEYIKKWIGHFYLWAGDDPSGFDCSGLIVEVLQSVGILPHKSDFTADGLFQKYKNHIRSPGYKGCLVFWMSRTQDKAIHVEIMVDNYHVVGASGGNSKTKTIADAVKQNAFVKMRPISYRGYNYKICDPFAKRD